MPFLYLQYQNSMAKQTSKLREKLTNKYRMVILNEETFEERVSFKLSRLNVYVFGGLFSILMIISTILLIAYTPLREYIPGYSSSALNRKASNLQFELDSLKHISQINNTKLSAMIAVLKGEEEITTYKDNIDSILKANHDEIEHGNLVASKEDSIFRAEIEKQDKYNIYNSQTVEIGTVLFAPVSGTITNEFNSENEHFAVDIAVQKEAPVKAIADGTVIFAEWSVDTGFVIILDHGNNLISVYKHNALLYSHQGDLVKTGEAIAAAGSTGSLSTGTHLHFELWYNGYPVNPTNFIEFE